MTLHTRRGKAWRWGVGIAVVLIGGAMIAWRATSQQSTIQERFTRGWKELITAPSVRMQWTVDIALQGGVGEEGDATVHVRADSIRQNRGDQSRTRGNARVDLSVPGMFRGSTALETRGIDRDQYVTLTDWSVTDVNVAMRAPLDQVSGLVQGFLQGRWFRMDTNQLPGILSSVWVFQKEQQQWASVLAQQPLIIESIGETTVHGGRIMDHVVLRVDPQVFERLTIDAQPDDLSEQVDPVSTFLSPMTLFSLFGALPFDAWIDHRSGRIGEMTFSFDRVRDAASVEHVALLQNLRGVTVRMQTADWGARGDVQAPDDALSISELLAGASMQIPGGDSTDDTDRDGLTRVQEVFLRTDPNNADSDGDGFTDGEEVKNGYDPNGPGRFFPSYDRVP